MDITTEMVAEAILWVGIATARPVPDAELHVVAINPHEMAMKVPECRRAIEAGQILVHGCPTVGLYDWGTNTLWIANWLDASRTKAFLVHEIGHWYQDVYMGVTGAMSCAMRIEVEDRAYALQNRYIKEVLHEDWTAERPLLPCQGE